MHLLDKPQKFKTVEKFVLVDAVYFTDSMAHGGKDCTVASTRTSDSEGNPNLLPPPSIRMFWYIFQTADALVNYN
jgi:hypothetical protein